MMNLFNELVIVSSIPIGLLLIIYVVLPHLNAQTGEFIFGSLIILLLGLIISHV
jgi:hypothetical protein